MWRAASKILLEPYKGEQAKISGGAEERNLKNYSDLFFTAGCMYKVNDTWIILSTVLLMGPTTNDTFNVPTICHQL
jgi:hypothetical protein